MKKLIKFYQKKLPAYTLVEIMVVLIIIGILILLALPNLLPLITKAKSTEAKLQLEQVYRLEKSYYYQYSKYSTDLKEIDFEPEKLVTENGQANYRIQIISASNNQFIIQATSVTDFDGDGIMNVWEINQDNQLKETIKD